MSDTALNTSTLGVHHLVAGGIAVALDGDARVGRADEEPELSLVDLAGAAALVHAHEEELHVPKQCGAGIS